MAPVRVCALQRVAYSCCRLHTVAADCMQVHADVADCPPSPSPSPSPPPSHSPSLSPSHAQMSPQATVETTTVMANISPQPPRGSCARVWMLRERKQKRRGAWRATPHRTGRSSPQEHTQPDIGMGIQPPDDPSCLESSACGCGAVGTDGSTLLSDGVLDRDDWTKARWARWQGKREQRRNTWRSGRLPPARRRQARSLALARRRQACAGCPDARACRVSGPKAPVTTSGSVHAGRSRPASSSCATSPHSTMESNSVNTH